jgi:Opioid growth factor receptor (OGFr) conserved region
MITMDKNTPPPSPPAPLHAYLAGAGVDSRGRSIEMVLALPDNELESIHDYIQWLFPLQTRSGAQPLAPVLTSHEVEAIRADTAALSNLTRAADRMLRFYSKTTWWLRPYDHNHLRITRILHSLKLLAGSDASRAFYKAILDLHEKGGAPVNGSSLRFWAEAA